MTLESSIIYGVVFVALAIGTYTDFKTREVPDWISYGLIFSGIGLRGIFSLATHNWAPIVEGLAGLGIFFLLAVIMFYAGQWGGGDAKVLMGLGTLLGVQLSIHTFLIGFIVNTIIFGSILGLGYSTYLALTHKKEFQKKFMKLYSKMRIQKYLFWIGSGIMLILGFLIPEVKIAAVMFAILLFATYYLIVFIKSVEDACMIKDVPPEKLTEGDWIVNDVVVDGKKVCGPKDLGIEKEQIAKLIKLKKQKKINLITIKEGMPFVPAFLAGFIATLVWGNLIFAVIL